MKTIITAAADAPAIEIVRDFAAPAARVQAAHVDKALFAQWIGPDGRHTTIKVWDARTGGEWAYLSSKGYDFQSFRGCFHFVGPTKIVQTFTWEGQPDHVALETVTFEDLPDAGSRLRAVSLSPSYAARDAWLNHDMATGVEQGYAKLDAILATR